MPSQKDVRPIRALAFLLAFLVLALLAGVAGLLIVPPARADEPKLDSEKLSDSVGRSGHSALHPQQASGRRDELHSR